MTKTRHISYKYFKHKLEPAIIWKVVTCQRITSKKYSTSMGPHLSPRCRQVILVSGYPVLTAVNWSLLDHSIDVQSVFSWAPKLARKCESCVMFRIKMAVSKCFVWPSAMPCLMDAKIALVPKHPLKIPSFQPYWLLQQISEHTKPQRYIRSHRWHMSYF